MNYSKILTHRLLRRIVILNWIKERGVLCGMPLTQLGQDWINAELSAIDVELDRRRPNCEFRILLDSQNEPVGFEVS